LLKSVSHAVSRVEDLASRVSKANCYLTVQSEAAIDDQVAHIAAIERAGR